MSFLRTTKTAAPQYTWYPLQTASSALPIPICYGNTKLAPNILWQGGFSWHKTGGSGGGKGGGGNGQYDYRTWIIFGLCEGPIVTTGLVWDGNNKTGIGWLNLSLFKGDTPQSPYGPMSAAFPFYALNYNGTAYLASNYFDLGDSNSPSSLAIEMYGVVASTSFNGRDADPAQCVNDFLTNSQYGVGFPASSIASATLFGSGGDASYQTYCKAQFLALSPCQTTQEAASSILARWLQITNTTAVWSGGLLKFIPYGDSTLSGNGVTYVPNTTPVYNLTDDDFVHDGDSDPLQCHRTDPYAAYNWQELECLDRYNTYNATPVAVFDQHAIELYGLRKGSSITAHEICDLGIGINAAQLILQRNLYVRNTYTFKLSLEYCLLDPMDLVTITDPGLGLNNVAVRIQSIEEADDGTLMVVAEEFPGGVATAVQYPSAGAESNPINTGVIPDPVNAPIIFEPPVSLTGGTAQVWIAASGGVSQAYKLQETARTGYHCAQETMAVTQPSGTTVSFSLYVQAVERSACALQIFDGTNYDICHFNLSAGTASPGPNITASSITSVGSGWYLLSISVVMAATAAPIVCLFAENPIGTLSYAGTAGDGLYFWKPEYSADDEDLAAIQVLSASSGATVAAQPGLTTPEGAAGTVDPNWGGCYVWVSTDNVSYSQIGQINGPARQGTLTAAFPAFTGSNPDSSDTLSVSLLESGGTLSSGTLSDAQNAVTLAIVDNELLSYETATLTGPNAYNLTTLFRGLYGSQAVVHSSGARFARLDSAVFQYDLPSAWIGTTLYVKLQSFNIFGAAVQDLSTCVAYTYEPTGSGNLGPVSQALLVGTNLDYGLASAAVNESDDFGLASDPYTTVIDLGLASS
jgi:hypothetical protein